MFESISKAKNKKRKSASMDAVMERLAPVKLSDDDHNDYLNLFYPANTDSSIQAGDWGELGEFLLSISAGVSRCQSLLRYILQNAAHLDDLEPHEVADDLANRALTLRTVTKINSKNPEHRINIRDFYSQLHSGSAHLLKASERYSGGVDIVFQGSQDNTVKSWPTDGAVGTSAPMRTSKVRKQGEWVDHEDYAERKLTNYQTDLSLNALRAAAEIQKFLMGETPRARDLGDNKFKQIRFTEDFAKVEQIVLKNLGINSLGFFEEYENILKRRNLFDPAFSVLCSRSADEDLNRHLRQHRANLHAYNEQKATVDREDPYAVQRLEMAKNRVEDSPFRPQDITPEFLLVGSEFSFSIVMNMKEEYVRYATQKEKGDVSYYSLNTWLNSWSRSVLKAKGQSAGGQKVSELPRFVIPASNSKDIADFREQEGYAIEKGKGDSSRISISPSGGLQYVPNNEDFDPEPALEYEKLMDEILKTTLDRNDLNPD